MFTSALSVRLRLGALVLLASVLPLAVQAPAPPGTGRAVRPAAWLRAQVGGARGGPALQRASRSAFDRALAEAEAADTHTLHGFLAAFLGAHARATNAGPALTQGRSCRALVQDVRRALVQAGFVVQPRSSQASAPPVAPLQRARWLAASSLVPLSDRFTAARGRTPPPPARPAGRPASMWRAAPAAVARAVLARVLFAGRRLGP